MENFIYNFKLSDCESCVFTSTEECSFFHKESNCQVEKDITSNLEEHLTKKNFSDNLPMSLLIETYIDLNRIQRLLDKTSTRDLYTANDEEFKKYSKFISLKEKKVSALTAMLHTYGLTPKAQQDFFIKANKLQNIDKTELTEEKVTEFFTNEKHKIQEGLKNAKNVQDD